MPFSFDPEIGAGLAALFPETPPRPPVGDVATRREMIEPLQREIHALLPMPPDVTLTDYETTAQDGATLMLRWYAKNDSAPGSAVLYTHGGGMICSNVAIYDRPLAQYVSTSGVPFLAVEFRYAPEHPAPTPVTDCFAGLQWLFAHATELSIDPARIAIMGDSGGGGVAASLAIYARDHGVVVAKQILIQAMLDDRNTTPDPELARFATWTYEDNVTGWGALLGDAAGGPDVSPYGSPSRLDDFSGLPPAYIEVSDLDIFRDESIAYAQRLSAAGVSAELHVYPAAPHSFHALVPTAAVSRRAVADRERLLATL
jgi:acetyl esterase/lipase